ncbi:DNA ligase [Agrobacterium sp. T29]|uniref:HTH-like domain-containing protein n=1 Tax=Agrobacterium sp. T29 TaxID=2580515 RepID=UPI00115DA98C|nr:DNA ligase [Agrobacterium sp. T29]
MNETQAAQLLRDSYDRGAVTREQATSVHLFGIQYAEELANLSLPDILARAKMPATYKTEIRKGMKLAPYVRLRD